MTPCSAIGLALYAGKSSIPPQKLRGKASGIWLSKISGPLPAVRLPRLEAGRFQCRWPAQAIINANNHVNTPGTLDTVTFGEPPARSPSPGEIAITDGVSITVTASSRWTNRLSAGPASRKSRIFDINFSETSGNVAISNLHAAKRLRLMASTAAPILDRNAAKLTVQGVRIRDASRNRTVSRRGTAAAFPPRAGLES